MKPKIDLSSPIVNIAIEALQKQVVAALETPQTVESAIIPIYAVPKSKAHNKKRTKPIQIGSGVLVKIKEEYFIFCATHVFLEFNNCPILIGSGDGTLVKPILGERFSTGNPNTPNSDSFDASVYYVQTSLNESFKKIAITLDDFDFDGYDSRKPIYMASGFRVKKSNTSGNSVNSHR